MPKISYFDINKEYGKEIQKDADINLVSEDEYPLKLALPSWSIEDVLNKLEREDNFFRFREEFLALCQLFFDGLIERKYDLDSSVKEEIFNKIKQSGKSMIGSFYNGQGVNMDQVREAIFPYASEIVECSSSSKVKKRHLISFYEDVQVWGLSLQERIGGKIPWLDTLVGVAAGGFEPSFLAMYLADKNDVTMVRYRQIDQRDSDLMIPEGFDNRTERIPGKNVLVVEDWIERGTSLTKVLENTRNYGPKNLYGAAVFNCRGNVPKLQMDIWENKPFFGQVISSN